MSGDKHGGEPANDRGPNGEGKPEGDAKRRPVVKAVSWVAGIAVAAIVGQYAIDGSHSVAARAVCEVSYLVHPAESRPASSAWTGYGTTQLTRSPGQALSVEPAQDLATDMWFGAELAGPGTCDYQVSFDAELLGPEDRVLAPQLGYGYGVGARGSAINGIPHGTTVQFDPPFGGLRTVQLPGQVNSPGLNSRRYGFVETGHYSHWILTVRGSAMLVLVHGERYGPVDLGRANGGEILFRVWDGRLKIRNVEISKLAP
jgi:hypothetical protein